MTQFFRFFILLVLVPLLLWIPGAQAGVFSIPHFVTPGEFALGLEPELTLTSGAGVGVSARATYGLTDLNNVTAILGTGGGPRQFRAGGDATFDFFPDVQGQPGIGLALQGLFVRVPTPSDTDPSNTSGQVEITAMPYLHKSFVTNGNEVEPYFSVPFGMAFLSGQYRALSTIVVGSMFKTTEHIRYNVEFGVAVNNTNSYISGGVTYYH